MTPYVHKKINLCASFLLAVVIFVLDQAAIIFFYFQISILSYIIHLCNKTTEFYQLLSVAFKTDVIVLKAETLTWKEENITGELLYLSLLGETCMAYLPRITSK